MFAQGPSAPLTSFLCISPQLKDPQLLYWTNILCLEIDTTQVENHELRPLRQRLPSAHTHKLLRPLHQPLRLSPTPTPYQHSPLTARRMPRPRLHPPRVNRALLLPAPPALPPPRDTGEPHQRPRPPSPRARCTSSPPPSALCPVRRLHAVEMVHLSIVVKITIQ
ncbi:hypothetical protein C8J57DRAFT_1533574 [Mycena rebaudengoi]|nr:hypothetical protein C8J57DRAFT_1533574 [Mycena rebaudengoi]